MSCPLSKKGGLAYCFAAISLSVHQSFIYFSEIAHTEMKFIIQIFHKNIFVKFCVQYDRAIFDTGMLLGLGKIQIICNFHSFSFADVAYTEMELGMQICHKNYQEPIILKPFSLDIS